MIKLIISFIIYVISFYNLGNTLFRTNSTGKKYFTITPIFTEGFYGQIRTFFILLFYNNIKSAFIYLLNELFRMSNPYSAFLLINIIFSIFKWIKII